MNPPHCMRAFLPAVLIVACHGCAPPVPPPQPAQALPAATPRAPRPLSLFGDPLTGFVPNRGEFPGDVGYFVRGREGSICFTRSGVRYLSPAGGGFGLRFDGAQERTELRGEKKYRSGAGTVAEPRGFSILAYRNLYAGIDLEFRAGPEGLERVFMVDPGADPAIIRISYEGTSGLQFTPEQGLRIPTPHGDFIEKPPRAYQYISGEKVSVPMGYVLVGPRTAGFDLPRRDPRYLLVIDPAAGEGGGAR